MLLLMVLLLKLLGNWTYTTLVILTLIVHLPLLFLSFMMRACQVINISASGAKVINTERVSYALLTVIE